MPINKCELFLIDLEWQYRVDCSCDGAISRVTSGLSKKVKCEIF